MAPSQQQITVALDALEADAVMWTEAAAALHDAAAIAAGLRIDSTAFSFAGQTVAATYWNVHLTMTRLLTEGAGALDSIAAALRTSAEAYRAEEEAGIHRMRGIY
jgi:hypothetical protein